MTKLSAVLIIALSMVSQRADAQSSTPEPYELTSRGTIAFDANQRYKSAIEDCFNGEPGFAPSGPKFLECLERETHIQDATLNEIYRGAVGYLKGSPAKVSRLQEFKERGSSIGRRTVHLLEQLHHQRIPPSSRLRVEKHC